MIRNTNTYLDIGGGIHSLTVYRKNGTKYVSTINSSDVVAISKFTWRVLEKENNPTYLRTTNKGVNLVLHRLVLNPFSFQVVDHIDGNGLNNVRSNLRVCSHIQNQRNRHRFLGNFKGVTYHKRDKMFTSSIKFNSKANHLGYFKTEVEAAIAYNQAALKYFGEFARLNVIPEVN